MFLFRSVINFLLCFYLFGCAQKRDSSKTLISEKQEKIVRETTISKINGVSFVASRDSILKENISPLKEIHANYAAIMPFGFIKSLKHPEIIYNQKRQWFGETPEGAKQYIGMLHKNDIKIMMKPQIWVWHGEFTGLVKMASEADWLQLEDYLSKFYNRFCESG